MLNPLHWINKRLPALAAMVTVLLPALAASPAWGDVYKWQDAAGTIHFTDDPSSIPRAFRGKTRVLESNTSPKAPENHQGSNREPSPSNAQFTIPLQAKGGQFFIKALLNGHTQATLLLDTGATTVVLSEPLARKLGYTFFHAMPQVQAETAGGIIWAPLLSLREVRAGDAAAQEVEAIVSLKLKKVDGLMGMSFLNQFKMNLDYSSAVLTLKPLMDTPLYGGKTKKWWQDRFAQYRSKIRHFKKLAEDLNNSGDAKALNVEKTVQHYQTLYTNLKTRGSNAGIPSDIKPAD